VTAIAENVIAKADQQHTADAVLRTELKQARGISREEGRAVSRAVFAYYRWLGWLDERLPMGERIARALGFDDTFRKNPASIKEADLHRAIPSWVSGHVNISVEWLRALQTEPTLWLRARMGQGKQLAEKLGLGPSGRARTRALPDAVVYEGGEDLFRTPEFQAGEFELQDISSQVVGMVCNPQAGGTWWDACAGEGGKTLHLADLMGGKGLIWASDRAAWRLQKLKQRTARAKVFNYRSVLWDGGAKLPTRTKFDGILVDAPCAGVGTWQRNPHARWTTTAEDVAELGAVQKKLLANAVQALKPGGRLIYSVCTLTRAETTEVKAEITRLYGNLEPLKLLNPLEPSAPASESVWLWPQTVSGNGMFICGWQARS